MNRKLIGLYQLITGTFGLILIIYSGITQNPAILKNQQLVLQLIIGLLLFGLLAWSGYGLINKVKKAKQYSMFLQALQIPVIAIPGIYYKFSASNFFYAGWANGSFDFKLTGKVIDLTMNANIGNETIFMLGLVPIVLLYGLYKLK